MFFLRRCVILFGILSIGVNLILCTTPKPKTRSTTQASFDAELNKAISSYVSLISDIASNNKDIESAAISVLQISNELAEI
ncbi:hypothetical protein FQR65_LT04071 [Abscondita terminalis]|nr:hypothetical protein FQR65_LT04071 [Abscondita terminalis]